MSADVAALVAALIDFATLEPRYRHRDDWSVAIADARALVAADPSAIGLLAEAFLRHEADETILLDYLLSWLPPAQWPALVGRAMDCLRNNPRHDTALEVLRIASLQHGAAVHPFLKEVYALPRYQE